MLAVLVVATSVAMPQASPTKSEMDDARDSAKAFIDVIQQIKKSKDWTPLVDELERTAKRYVGKSKIQIAMLDREFPEASTEIKVKFSVMVLKLDEAAAQALRFTQAFREFKASLDPKEVDVYANQAKAEGFKLMSAVKEFDVASLDFAAMGKK
jgi:hypothetical protein